MPANSVRKQALLQAVSVLGSIVAGASYFTTLTGVGQVALVGDTDDARLSAHNITIRIFDEQETHVERLANRGVRTATLRLGLDVLIRSSQTNKLVETTNDVLRDLAFALAQNPTLNGAVNEAIVAEIDAPIYDTKQTLAAVVCHVVAEYDYETGITI